MTPNSLDGSTVFAYRNTLAMAPEARQQARRSGPLPVTQVMCFCFTSMGSIKKTTDHLIKLRPPTYVRTIVVGLKPIKIRTGLKGA